MEETNNMEQLPAKYRKICHCCLCRGTRDFNSKRKIREHESKYGVYMEPEYSDSSYDTDEMPKDSLELDEKNIPNQHLTDELNCELGLGSSSPSSSTVLSDQDTIRYVN